MSCSKQALGKKAREGKPSESRQRQLVAKVHRQQKTQQILGAKKHTTISFLHCIMRVSPSYYWFSIIISDYKIFHLLDTQ